MLRQLLEDMVGFFGHSAKWLQFHLEVAEGLKIWWVIKKYLIQILLSIRPRLERGGGGGQITPSRSDGPNVISFYRRVDHIDVISF